MSVTKLVKPRADYQQWLRSELSLGDIIDIAGSLGGRCANTVTIESAAGESTIRFNVAKKIYKEHGPGHNEWIGYGSGTTRSSPLCVAEIEESTPDIVISSGVSQTWTKQEIAIMDIKIVSMAPTFKITVA